MTWQVEQARLPSHAPSSSTSFECATCSGGMAGGGGDGGGIGGGVVGVRCDMAVPAQAPWATAALPGPAGLPPCQRCLSQRLVFDGCPACGARPTTARAARTSSSDLPSGACTVFSVPSLSSLNVTLMLRVGQEWRRRGAGHARAAGSAAGAGGKAAAAGGRRRQALPRKPWRAAPCARPSRFSRFLRGGGEGPPAGREPLPGGAGARCHRWRSLRRCRCCKATAAAAADCWQGLGQGPGQGAKRSRHPCSLGSSAARPSACRLGTATVQGRLNADRALGGTSHF